MILGKHAHQEMKKVVHGIKSQDFGEIDSGKTKSQGLQKVLVRCVERKPGQGSTGYDMIDGRCFRHEKPGNAGMTTSGSGVDG